jgi:hypothetical protein
MATVRVSPGISMSIKSDNLLLHDSNHPRAASITGSGVIEQHSRTGGFNRLKYHAGSMPIRSVTRMRSVGLVFLIGAVACGGSSGAPAKTDPLVQAAGTTAKSGAATISISGSWRSETASMSVQGSGAFDTADRKGWANLGMTVRASNVVRSRVVRSRFRAVFDGDRLWLGGTEAFQSDKHWLMFDRDWGTRQAATSWAVWIGHTASDVLHQLTASGNATRKLGQDRVAGSSTTHYRVAVKTLPPNAILRQMNAVPSPIDVWIDGAGRLRKARVGYTVEFDNPPATPARFTLTIILTQFGRPLSVTLPPASDTLPANEYVGN